MYLAFFSAFQDPYCVLNAKNSVDWSTAPLIPVTAGQRFSMMTPNIALSRAMVAVGMPDSFLQCDPCISCRFCSFCCFCVFGSFCCCCCSGCRRCTIVVVVGPSWGYVGPSWSYVEPSRGQVGRSWGHVGPSWTYVGPSWGHLGPSWSHVGPILGHLGAHMWPSWGYVGARGYPPIFFSDLCCFCRRAKNTVNYEVFFGWAWSAAGARSPIGPAGPVDRQSPRPKAASFSYRAARPCRRPCSAKKNLVIYGVFCSSKKTT